MHVSNEKHFLTNLSAEKIAELIPLFVKEKAQILLWKKGVENQTETFKIKKSNDSQQQLVCVLDDKKVKESNLKGTFVLAKLVYKETQYFFAAPLTYDGPNKQFLLNFPKDMYMTVQRKDCRLMSGPFAKIEIFINGNVFKALDVSASGTSFNIATTLKENYPKDKAFSNCKVTLNGEEFPVPKAKIVRVSEMKNPQTNNLEAYSIGVLFVDLPYDVDQKLFKKINEQMKLLTSKSFDQAS